MIERFGNRTPTYKVPLPEAERRLRELIVYIAAKCEHDPTYGATKLNKILFYSDFYSFATIGRPVTGLEYQRLEHGPAPRQLLPERRRLEQAGRVAMATQMFRAKEQKRVVALGRADLSVFSGDDIAIVDYVIEQLWGRTATQVSHISHGPWWKACFHGDSIPYEFAHLSAAPITAGDIERTGELAREHGWLPQP